MIDFEREKLWWEHKAHKEEQDRADEAINRALRWYEIERQLDGVSTILDIGGATGAFSIPLAQRGFQVTHFDIAPAMLAIAREKAQRLTNIEFVEGNAIDLSRYADNSFDLVLNMDGAISFCGEAAEPAIQEACRVTKSKLIIAVTHRGRMIPRWIDTTIQGLDRFSKAVDEMVYHGRWHQAQYPENALLSKGATDDYLGAINAFLPKELKEILQQTGMQVLRCGGLGSLASQCHPETIQRIIEKKELLEKFLEICEYYDREVLEEGPGTRQRAGLIAVAQKIKTCRPT
jgi:ubiquinone/menaquinone biosynthesis C-methylase UbiE